MGDEYRKMGCHCDLGVLCCHETESDTTDSVPHRPYNVIWKEGWNRILSEYQRQSGLWMAWHDMICYDKWQLVAGWRRHDVPTNNFDCTSFSKAVKLKTDIFALFFFPEFLRTACLMLTESDWLWLVVTVQICIFCVYNLNESELTEFDWNWLKMKRSKERENVFYFVVFVESWKMFEIKDDEEIKKGKKMKKDVVCTLVFCEYHFYCILSASLYMIWDWNKKNERERERERFMVNACLNGLDSTRRGIAIQCRHGDVP